MFQEKYRDFYIRTVFNTPFGKWAVANGEQGEVILQHVPVESPPQSLINQYLSLDHPLLIPYLDVYQEPSAFVFVRPYLLTEHLIHSIPLDKNTANLCCEQLAELEAYLKNQPLPMKIIYHPENIGVTDEGELRVFLCGDASYMRYDFSDRETFRKILIGGEQKEQTGKTEQEKEFQVEPPLVRESKPQVMVNRRTAILGAITAGILCFGAGLGLMKVLQKPEEQTVLVQSETSKQETKSPDHAPETEASDLNPAESTPPTQEDMDQSQAVAKEFVSSLDQDENQNILKKKARSMTVLPTMQAVRIDSRPGEITWRIEAEVFHSDGNMKGEIFKTVFRVVTVKENGTWKVKDAEVTGEKKE